MPGQKSLGNIERIGFDSSVRFGCVAAIQRLPREVFVISFFAIQGFEH
jgi:hypothetical protein